MNRIRCAVVAALWVGAGLLWSGERAFGAETFAVIGDAGKLSSGTDSVRESIRRNKVSRLVLPGDNLYHKTYSVVWQAWRDLAMTFDAVAIGNHNGGYEEEVDYFDMPGQYYSKVIDSTRFVVLNSDNDHSGPAQASWLAKVLEDAKEPFVFLVYHHPSYTVSSFHSWQEKKRFQSAVRPVIWKYRKKITALLVGHDHLATLLQFDDLPVVLSGAVKERRDDVPVNNTQDGVHVKTEWFYDSVPYWAKLETGTSRTSARVDFVRAQDDHVSCTATIVTGKAAELHDNCHGR